MSDETKNKIDSLVNQAWIESKRGGGVFNVWLDLMNMVERPEGAEILNDTDLRKYWQQADDAIYQTAFLEEGAFERAGYVFVIGRRYRQDGYWVKAENAEYHPAVSDSADGCAEDSYWTEKVDEFDFGQRAQTEYRQDVEAEE